MARLYATEAQLIEHGAPPGVTLPTGTAAAYQLREASLVIDEALLGAIYDTDTAGMPTATTVVEALRDATCAQVAWWSETGDVSGAVAASPWTSVSAGSVSLSGRAPGGGSAPRTPSGREIAPSALTHLRLAGLTPGAIGHAPVTYY